jgi:hypothetical protein
MSLVYPNIVPENNLRLPDALTIKHGPAPLLARFILEGDKAARRHGLTLRVRHDFEELVYLNSHQLPGGRWFRLVNTFNPQYTDLSPENSFWVSGENEHGEIVATHAGRTFYWPDTNLEEQAYSMFYGNETGQQCLVTAPAAKLISGLVLVSGAVWVHPDYRGNQFSHLFTRIGKAYSAARWPLDWAVAYMSRILIEKGFAAAAGGHKRVSYSVFYPGSPWGELEVVVAYSSTQDIYDDLRDFMMREFAGSGDKISDTKSSPNFIEDRVTKISSEQVFQGSSTRS